MFWKARKHKFKLLGPPGVAIKLKFKFLGPPGGGKTFKSKLSGPPGGPESLNINLDLRFLGFWKARNHKFKILGPFGGARKLKFKLLGPPGKPKPSNLSFLALPVAPKPKYKFGFIFKLCGLGERFGLAQHRCHRSCFLGLSISVIKICSPWQFF